MSAAPRMSGAERGTAFHKVMEHIPFTAELEKLPEFLGSLTDDISFFVEYYAP